MKKPVLFALVLAVLIACKNEEKKPGDAALPDLSEPVDSFLVTDSTWGLIRARTDIAELKRIFGDNNIRDVRECDAECIDSIDVTKVYPGQANEITIIWKDTAYHKEIGLIECFGEKPAWHSAEGIKIGSGLKDLLEVNGRKISFYGFGWDYGGTVDSYNGGRLEKSRIGYRLNLNEYNNVDNSLYGDTGLDTDMPAVKKVMDKISVWWITLSFYTPPAE